MTKSPFPPNTRIVAYLRDSGGRDQELSVAQQEKAVGEWCRERSLILTHVFADAARSGRGVSERTRFLEMVDYLDGQVPEAGVIFWEYARLSRDYDDFQFFVADLRRRGYVVYSITDLIPDGLEGRLMESIMAWKNAKFSQDLAKNVKRGMRYMVSAYKARPGVPATGYMLEPVETGKRRDGSLHIVQRMIPHPEKAPLVRKAFEMRAAGATYEEIHNETHLFTWLTEYGRMLHNRVYIGIGEYGDIEVQDYCEPLVDQATWDIVQDINNRRRRRDPGDAPRTVRSRFFLRGMAICSVCKHPLYAVSSFPEHGINFDYYRCKRVRRVDEVCKSPNIPKNELEQRVLTAARERILKPDIFEDTYKALRRQSPSDNREATLRKLHHDLTQTQAAITRMVAAIRDTGHSSALIAELANLEKSQAELITQISTLEQQNRREVTIPNPAAMATQIAAALESAEDTQKATILRGFIRSIRVARINGEIIGEIEWGLPGMDGSTTIDL